MFISAQVSFRFLDQGVTDFRPPLSFSLTLSIYPFISLLSLNFNPSLSFPLFVSFFFLTIFLSLSFPFLTRHSLSPYPLPLSLCVSFSPFLYLSLTIAHSLSFFCLSPHPLPVNSLFLVSNLQPFPSNQLMGRSVVISLIKK